MSMTKNEFQSAFHKGIENSFADVPTKESEINFCFSQAFLQKMENLIQIQQEGLWQFFRPMRKRVAVAVILLAGIGITACGINQAITHLYTDVYEEMREEFHAGVTADKIDHTYKIEAVPDGFVKVRITKDTSHVIAEYENKARDNILFLQDATTDIEISLRSETLWEDPELKRIVRTSTVIRGLDVELFQNKYLCGAIWIEDGYFMEIMYHGCEDIEDVKAMVESIK